MLFRSLNDNNVVIGTGVNNLDNKLVEKNIYRYKELYEKYNVVDNKIFITTTTENDFLAASIRPMRDLYKNDYNCNIVLSKKHFNDYNNIVSITKNNINKNFFMDCSPEYYDVYAFTHEYGHVIQNKIIGKRFKNNNKYINAVNINDRTTMINMYDEESDKMMMDMIVKVFNGASEITMSDMKKYCSEYALTKSSEFFAEAFANLECGKPNKVGLVLKEFLEQEGI